MKDLILPVLLGFFFSSGAQNNFNRGHHNKNEMAVSLIGEMQGDLYFLSRSVDLTNYGDNFLCRYNAAGSLISRTAIGHSWFLKGTPALGNRFLFAGTDQLCDVLPPVIRDYLELTGSTGAMIDSVAFDHALIAFAQTTDSTIFAFTEDSMMYRYSASLSPLSSVSHTFGAVHAVLALNGNLLVNHSAGGFFYLTTVNSAGAVISSNSIPYVALKKMVPYGNGSVMGNTTSGDLLRFSSTCKWISTQSLPSFSDFAVSGSTVYAIGDQSYFTIDTGLTGITNGLINSTVMAQKEIKNYGTMLAVLSQGTVNVSPLSNGGPQYFAALGVFPVTGANHLSKDIELTALLVDSSYAVPYGGMAPPHLRWVYSRFKVNITNKGTSTINSVTLNQFDYVGVACGSTFFQETFTGVNLAAGNSTWVTSGSFVRCASQIDNSGNVPADYCLYTSLPDGETDKAHPNNERCHSFLVTSLAARKDPLSLNVYPNPSSGLFLVETSLMIRHLEVVDVFGKHVWLGKSQQFTATIDLSDQPQGVYFMSVVTSGGTVFKKLVKR